MDKHIGGIDWAGRIVHGAIVVIAGIAALTGYWAAGAVIGGVGLLVGVILFVTGTTQKCPINEAVGIDTTDRKKVAGYPANGGTVSEIRSGDSTLHTSTITNGKTQNRPEHGHFGV
ncbi:hypothetical protein DQW50_06350 [Halorubrum sp. 48-1-W]|uniref:YgaP family membrane protein n=1 Tax=Halorubrum sp. 48-1-W TaxID=2249761 RepID=UPI000DCF1133|nr:DUF2892 domain-containing protein [Halorubrum sp. 48-1-W]RAW45831.1 hypothetical protein DQW50_06350 [Halorubrum sp. 48-1-W]